MLNGLACRACGQSLENVFVDLGMSPLSNAYVRGDQLQQMEPFYPLKVYVCAHCFLVQLPAVATPEQIFTDYAYFSSFSDTWLQHAKSYCDQMVARFGFGASHQVIEVASNDGYLLQYFRDLGVPVLGIEPAANVARAAEERGVPTIVKFFGAQTADELNRIGKAADLLVGNNVLAHVPDINDFVEGIARTIKAGGICTLEFPHLFKMMERNEFDTIYHEHFSYLSLYTVEGLFASHNLTVFDVDELPTHGGSLRVYGRRADRDRPAVSKRVHDLRDREGNAGVDKLETYAGFADRVHSTKRRLLEFLIEAKNDGKRVVGYGAPAKGNTLLNYCGIRTDLIEFTVDRSPHKQGLFLPGTRIPIYAPERIFETRPDYVLVLPWNLKDEIVQQMHRVTEWGGKFVVPIPSLEVVA